MTYAKEQDRRAAALLEKLAADTGRKALAGIPYSLPQPTQDDKADAAYLAAYKAAQG